jgi:hypothetical protein
MFVGGRGKCVMEAQFQNFDDFDKGRKQDASRPKYSFSHPWREV